MPERADDPRRLIGWAVAAAATAVVLLWLLYLARNALLLVYYVYLIQQQVENHLLVPKIMERQLGVSAATVIVALLVGSAVLGIVGALLAVPTAAIIQVLVQELVLKEDDTESA